MGLSSLEAGIAGGIGAMTASATTHPIELIKVRRQLAGELSKSSKKFPIGQLLMQIKNAEGISGFYRGLSASLLRQGLYSTTRFGLYGYCKTLQTPQTPIYVKIAMSMGSGALGALASTPADLVLIRMLADGRLEPHLRRNYKNVGDGILRVMREEGVFALWRGCWPNMVRAMVTTACQLVTYDSAKKFILRYRILSSDGLATHTLSSLMAGLVTATCALPVDSIRTRLMNSHGQHYRGTLDCAIKTIQHEGPLGLYKGFVPYYTRVGPQVLTMFLVYEQVAKLIEYGKDMKVPAVHTMQNKTANH
eukprot:comp14982_c0_seq1/m.11586 comp14982_c0_seq1/g.11586  ORF comp14982_c0_seq1/g.11586 comp14982_c0_seq1/m.11586 type:complete len:306 (-) comp14982_c0_seq1:420-1337(-)